MDWGEVYLRKVLRGKDAIALPAQSTLVDTWCEAAYTASTVAYVNTMSNTGGRNTTMGDKARNDKQKLEMHKKAKKDASDQKKKDAQVSKQVVTLKK
jgi:hypothetical protein